eukprot:31155-Pelagococcus_subviridis.AAC.10
MSIYPRREPRLDPRDRRRALQIKHADAAVLGPGDDVTRRRGRRSRRRRRRFAAASHDDHPDRRDGAVLPPDVRLARVRPHRLSSANVPQPNLRVQRPHEQVLIVRRPAREGPRDDAALVFPASFFFVPAPVPVPVPAHAATADADAQRERLQARPGRDAPQAAQAVVRRRRERLAVVRKLYPRHRFTTRTWSYGNQCESRAHPSARTRTRPSSLSSHNARGEQRKTLPQPHCLIRAARREEVALRAVQVHAENVRRVPREDSDAPRRRRRVAALAVAVAVAVAVVFVVVVVNAPEMRVLVV